MIETISTVVKKEKAQAVQKENFPDGRSKLHSNVNHQEDKVLEIKYDLLDTPDISFGQYLGRVAEFFDNDLIKSAVKSALSNAIRNHMRDLYLIEGVTSEDMQENFYNLSTDTVIFKPESLAVRLRKSKSEKIASEFKSMSSLERASMLKTLETFTAAELNGE